MAPIIVIEEHGVIIPKNLLEIKNAQPESHARKTRPQVATRDSYDETVARKNEPVLLP